MRIEDLNAAIFEANRFLKKAIAAKQKFANEKWHNDFYTCKEAAAAKRASMDLSRALTKIRRYRED